MDEYEREELERRLRRLENSVPDQATIARLTFGVAAAGFAVILAVVSSGSPGWHARRATAIASFVVPLITISSVYTGMTGWYSDRKEERRLAEQLGRVPGTNSRLEAAIHGIDRALGAAALLAGWLGMWLVGFYAAWSVSWTAANAWILGSVFGVVVGIAAVIRDRETVAMLQREWDRLSDRAGVSETQPSRRK